MLAYVPMKLELEDGDELWLLTAETRVWFKFVRHCMYVVLLSA